MRIIVRVLIPLALIAVTMASCGSDGSSSSVDLTGKKFENEQGKRAVTVEAVDNNFEPAYISVSAGTKITFVNRGHNKHNVVWVGDTFPASGLLVPAQSVKDSIDTPGDYAYYCSLHGTPTSGMRGGIRVVK